MRQKIRVVIAKPGLDGHDRGAKVIARALRDAGMEVIYTGLRQTPEQIVGAALQEDADVIGLSILSGAHMHICPRVDGAAAREGADDVLVVVGGIIPDVDMPKLNAMGIAGIFLPGTPMQEIVDFINRHARTRVGPALRATVMHKLLLADDSVTIQRVIELTFSGEDVQVVTVSDGEQAIARIPIERPDIVLADIGMPKRSGYEVAAFVKGRPDLAHIPVLLLAGAFEPVDEARAEQVKCDGVLVKPFEPQQVIARVRELRRRRPGARIGARRRRAAAEPAARARSAETARAGAVAAEFAERRSRAAQAGVEARRLLPSVSTPRSPGSTASAAAARPRRSPPEMRRRSAASDVPTLDEAARLDAACGDDAERGPSSRRSRRRPCAPSVLDA